MVINITTAYNVGDTFFALHFGKIIKEEVKSILISINEDGIKKAIFSSQSRGSFYEEEMYHTQEELIEAIRYNEAETTEG